VTWSLKLLLWQSNKTAAIWHVRLLFWSIWFSVIWVGWWAALAVAIILPHLLRYTLGFGAVSLRKYFDWLTALKRPVAFVGWAIAVYVSYNPGTLLYFLPSLPATVPFLTDLHPLVIHIRFSDPQNHYPSSANTLALIGRFCTGILLSSLILLGEKYAIQFIAYKFHQRSYADRISHQKRQVECLVRIWSSPFTIIFPVRIY